jgi:hypothetical protein
MADRLTELLLRPPVEQAEQPRPTPKARVSPAVLLVAGGLIAALVILLAAALRGSPTNHSIVQAGMVDATTGRPVASVVVPPHAKWPRFGAYLAANETTLCIGPAEAHCETQDAARFTCPEPHAINAITGTCVETASVERIFQAHVGDLIRFRVPLAMKIQPAAPFVVLYVQQAQYVRAKHKLLLHIAAQEPGPKYAGATIRQLPPLSLLCPPDAAECPFKPDARQLSDYVETLAHLTLDISADSDFAKLYYLPGSLTLSEPNGHVLAQLPGNPLYASGIALANLKAQAPRALTFTLLVGSA